MRTHSLSILIFLLSLVLAPCVQAQNITPMPYGGTGANITPAAGRLVYSTSGALALSGAGTSGHFVRSGGTSAPTFYELLDSSGTRLNIPQVDGANNWFLRMLNTGELLARFNRVGANNYTFAVNVAGSFVLVSMPNATETISGIKNHTEKIVLKATTNATLDSEERTTEFGQNIRFLNGAGTAITGISKDPSDNLILGPGVISGDHSQEMRISTTGKVEIGAAPSNTDHQLAVSGTAIQRLFLETTDAGSNGARLTTFHNSASPANGDNFSGWFMNAKSSTGVIRNAANITGQWVDTTNSSMDSKITFRVMNNVNANDVNTVAELTSLGVWADASDASRKDYEGAPTWGEVIPKLKRLTLERYHGRGDLNPQTRHFGPTAQEWHEEFGLGEEGSMTIAPKDLASIALLAILELEQRVTELQQRVTALEGAR